MQKWTEIVPVVLGQYMIQNTSINGSISIDCVVFYITCHIIILIKLKFTISLLSIPSFPYNFSIFKNAVSYTWELWDQDGKEADVPTLLLQ